MRTKEVRFFYRTGEKCASQYTVYLYIDVSGYSASFPNIMLPNAEEYCGVQQ
jgi:hypothetical protein